MIAFTWHKNISNLWSPSSANSAVSFAPTLLINTQESCGWFRINISYLLPLIFILPPNFGIQTWTITQPQKKSKLMPFVTTWMDLETGVLREVRQTKNKCDIVSLICKIFKDGWKWTYSYTKKNRNRITDVESKLTVTRDRRRGA